MRTSLVTLVLILSFGIEACSATYVLTTVPQQTPYFTTQYMSFDEMKAKGHGETFTIVMTDGNRVRGTLVQADAATIAWTDSKAGSIRSIPISQVEHLELSRNYVWEGVAVGLLLCTVPPLAAGAWGPQQPGGPNSVNYDGRHLVVMGGVFGGFAGAGVGSTITTTDVFQVPSIAGQSRMKSDSTK
jgi:hypothetical protein